ncbi:helix-turn-helix transcriptional regulator [Streptomyces sp. NPDC000851]
MSTALADNVRQYRRTAGLSQEGLAEAADLSLSTVRKAEQGGHVSMETLHALARALGVSTSALFATEAPKSVLGPEDEANRRYLGGAEAGSDASHRALCASLGTRRSWGTVRDPAKRSGRTRALPVRPVQVRRADAA